MAFLPLIVYISACYFAFVVVRSPEYDRPGCWIGGVWVCVISYLTLLAWPWFGDEQALIIKSIGGVWFGIGALYGLWLFLLPSGLLRLVGGTREMAFMAVLATMAAPIIAMYSAHMWGDPGARYSEGLGNAGDLHFLNPMALATSTRGDGFVTHRVRIHFLVVGALVLASSLLHLIPVRTSGEDESD